jgi:hypothetical protein
MGYLIGKSYCLRLLVGGLRVKPSKFIYQFFLKALYLLRGGQEDLKLIL